MITLVSDFVTWAIQLEQTIEAINRTSQPLTRSYRRDKTDMVMMCTRNLPQRSAQALSNSSACSWLADASKKYEGEIQKEC
jgi:hypothetical protein